MKNENNDLTLINEVYRNAKTAILSIDAIIGDVSEMDFFNEIKQERDGYNDVLDEISCFMKEHGYAPVEVSAIKKTGMNIGIKMNTAFDNSTTHLAELMIKGTVTGICELKRLINGGKTDNEGIINLATKLLDVEENYEKRLKNFL